VKHSSGILDNKSLGNVVSELKGNIAAGCTLSVVSALFSLYAYDELKKMSIHGKSVDGIATTRFSGLTRNGSDMSHYRNLLSKAVQALTGAAEERGVESLFSPGGTVINKNSFKGMDDFEVVSYLILLDESADDAEERRL